MSLVIVATMSNTSKISTNVHIFSSRFFFILSFSEKRIHPVVSDKRQIPFRQTRNIKSLDFKQKLCEDLDDGS